ncbi:MAG: transglutaminase TgpA family protein [Acidobacteriota bacterium]
MVLSKLYKIALYLVLATSFLGLWLSGGVDRPSLLLYALALVGSWFWTEDRSLLSPWAQWALALSYLAFFPIDLLKISGFFLSLVHLIFFIAIAKLFQVRKERDDQLLLLIAFGQVLVAATATVEISFLVTTILFVFAITLALHLHEIRRRMRRQSAGTPAAENWRGVRMPARAFVGLTTLTTATTLALAVPIFFVIPRFNEQLFRGFGQSRLIETGFSDRVELGQIGRIKQNYRVVFRVHADWAAGLGRDAPLPPDLKWRGMALDWYDNRSWRSTPETSPILVRPGRGPSWVVEPKLRHEPLLRQTIYLEPVSVPALFAAREPQWVSGDVGRQLRVDQHGSIFFSAVGRKRIYTVHSRIQDRHDTLGRKVAGEISQAMAPYLQLPDSLDSRIRDLAIGLTRKDVNIQDKALRLESYLLGLGYTMDNPSGGAADPLADFLFRTRAGHCEYFATAQAILLRTLGIPARIVNGYRRGDFNPISGDFVVRQANAHSWVEAFFPSLGWIEFDPTPPESELFSNTFVKWVLHLTDSLDLFWTDKVVSLTFFKQAQIFSSVRRRISGWGDLAINSGLALRKRWDRTWKAWTSGDTGAQWSLESLWLPALVVPLVLLGILWWRREAIWMWVLRRGHSRQRSAALIVYSYQKFLRWASRHGYQKEPGETAREFVARFAGSPVHPAALEITEVYQRVRFNDENLSDAAAQRLQEALKGLRARKVASRRSPVAR